MIISMNIFFSHSRNNCCNSSCDTPTTMSACYASPDEVQIAFIYDDFNYQTQNYAEIVHAHPKYAWHTAEYDIALLRMKDAIRCSNFTKPLCLPTLSNLDRAGAVGTVAGWGQKQGSKFAHNSSHTKGAFCDKKKLTFSAWSCTRVKLMNHYFAGRLVPKVLIQQGDMHVWYAIPAEDLGFIILELNFCVIASYILYHTHNKHTKKWCFWFI